MLEVDLYEMHCCNLYVNCFPYICLSLSLFVSFSFFSSPQNHGNPTGHIPELVLNNFATRLGHRVGRLCSLFINKRIFELKCNINIILTNKFFCSSFPLDWYSHFSLKVQNSEVVEWWLFTINEISYSSDIIGVSPWNLLAAICGQFYALI